MKIIFFISIVIFEFFGDSNNHWRETVKSNNTVGYKQAKIYCWCFKTIKADSGKAYYISPCTTFSSVGYDELINEKNLLISVSKSDQIVKLVKALNKGRAKKIEKDMSNDSRFVIVLTRDNGTKDIYYTNNATSFNTNKNTYLIFNFNIIRNISDILDVQINCSE